MESHPERLSRLLTALFGGYTGPGFSIRLWDGWQWNFGEGSGEWTLLLNSPKALEILARCVDEVALGEAFVNKEIDIEGDLISAFSIADYLTKCPRGLLQSASEFILAHVLSLKRWFEHGPRHSKRRDSASIAYHYDVPVEFYRRWLGKTLAYSCAYFLSGEDALDQAQEQKLDLICRKLRLRPREHFLDVGCGWGSLVLHAACRYHVKAHGITLSLEQASVANQRIRSAGLTDLCTVEHRDYRNCQDFQASFDKISSVGMCEHVGLPNLPLYFAAVHRFLKPGGTFLNHGIVRCATSSSSRRSFVDHYVFPDGRLVTLNEVIKAAEGACFEVRDVENLREHYELTLRKWVDGLIRNKQALLNMVPETTYRIWLLYTAGSAAAFRNGQIAVFQTVLSRLDNGRSRLPLVRDDWYVNQAEYQFQEAELIGRG